jgi:short-subunit dehydrogenase
MKNLSIIIIGVNADIGFNVCQNYLNKGAKIIGTYGRKKPKVKNLRNKTNLQLIKCDITKKTDLVKLKTYLNKIKFRWDLIFSSVGTSEPIGPFFKLNFSEWEKSFNVNAIAQLQIIHKLYNLKNKKKKCSIAFLAGGGTNGPMKNYSAYCASKITLIKMCELLHDENKDLNIFILGPGFTKTKTHLQTLKAGPLKAGSNYFRVKKFWHSSNQGTSFKEIFDCINWCIRIGPQKISGRNISIVHDKWGTKNLTDKLFKNNNMYKLRRYGN